MQVSWQQKGGDKEKTESTALDKNQADDKRRIEEKYRQAESSANKVQVKCMFWQKE